MSKFRKTCIEILPDIAMIGSFRDSRKRIPQLEQQLKKDATVISFAFAIPDWSPIKIIKPFPEKKKGGKIYIYQR